MFIFPTIATKRMARPVEKKLHVEGLQGMASVSMSIEPGPSPSILPYPASPCCEAMVRLHARLVNTAVCTQCARIVALSKIEMEAASIQASFDVPPHDAVRLALPLFLSLFPFSLVRFVCVGRSTTRAAETSGT